MRKKKNQAHVEGSKHEPVSARAFRVRVREAAVELRSRLRDLVPTRGSAPGARGLISPVLTTKSTCYRFILPLKEFLT